MAAFHWWRPVRGLTRIWPHCAIVRIDHRVPLGLLTTTAATLCAFAASNEVHRRNDKRLTASMSVALFASILGRTHCVTAEEVKTDARIQAKSLAQPIQLPDGDKSRIVEGLQATMDDILLWAAQPESWWDERWQTSAKGVGKIAMYCKSDALQGPLGPAKLFLGVAVFEDITLEETRYLTAGGDGAAKLRFDPVLNSFETRLSFEAPWGEPIILLRALTNPACLGIVSAREVDDFCTWRGLPDGRWMECGAGLHSPRMAPFIDGTEVVSILRDAPPSGATVRAIDLSCGYIHEPLDASSKAGGRGRVRLWYFLSSHAGGNVPKWAAEKGASGSIEGFFPAAYKEWQTARVGIADANRN